MLLKIGIILCTAISIAAHADIYQWIDNHGQTHYSNKKPENIEPSKITIDKTKEKNKLSYDDGRLNLRKKAEKPLRSPAVDAGSNASSN